MNNRGDDPQDRECEEEGAEHAKCHATTQIGSGLSLVEK